MHAFIANPQQAPNTLPAAAHDCPTHMGNHTAMSGLTRHMTAWTRRYLSYVLYPCVVGYAIYALIYEKHTSWYSFILNSLVGAVYTFGFILMCPQVPVLPQI